MFSTLSIKKTKKQGLEHAEKRCLERYRAGLTPELKAELLDAARNRPIKRIYRPGCGRYVCTVAAGKRVFRIVTDAAMETIITFLPRKRKHAQRERI